MNESKTSNHWLMKSEPESFSYKDLLKAPKQTTFWEGVRNYQARNFMRDHFKVGDRVLFYHSNAEPPAVMGTAVVVKEGYPDHSALDPLSDYYDESALKKGVNPWVMVDVQAHTPFKRPVTRAQLQAEPKLKAMMVLQKGSRLSVQPVSQAEFECVVALGCQSQ